MCGIAGVISNNKGKEVIGEMLRCMRHRGPDDSGTYVDDHAAIGMNRLAILDLSPLGHQPMQSHCKRYWIVYNGECYNYPDIRKKLEANGHQFTSRSDTEVVLQAFVTWGERCLHEMNGMFAFAIWDTLEQELFAARDHLGIKPFYYAIKDGAFIFGSELKTLSASGLIDRSLDHQAIFQYFSFGHVQQPRTILKDVQALMPGHRLIWKNESLSIKPYWSLTIKPSALNYNDATELLRIKINQAVNAQLISDRPLGLFLSGGLDSASVLAAMNSSGASIKTFSIGFDENPYAKNEAVEAQELAQFFGADHHQIILDSATVIDELDGFWKALDQPSTDGLNTYLVSKYAREQMTVALSGLGGDELFAGYARHARIKWKLEHGHALSVLGKSLIPEKLIASKNKLGRFAYRVKQNLDRGDVLRNYTYSRSLAVLPDTLSLLNPTLTDQFDFPGVFFGQYENLVLPDQSTELTKILAYDVQGFMESVLLRDMDAASMWHSLEVRFPLIDYTLVEFAFSLPDHFKLQRDQGHKPAGEGTLSYKESGAKKILLDAMQSALPKGFGERPKNGFKLPINLWLKGMRREQLRALVMDEKHRWSDVLNSDSIDSLWRGEMDYATLWKVLCFIRSTKALLE